MRQQKEDSYLHPRQLDYKRSPETRKKSKVKKKPMKDAAKVNSCTVKTHKPEIQRERKRLNRGEGNFQGQTNRSDGGIKAERRETVKANKRKSMEEKRRAERVEFYFTGQLEAKTQKKKHR